jgi:hypothetical protein
MTYETLGHGTSAVEVTNVSRHGFWLLLHEKEVFLPFEKFPWFRDAPIGKILHVEFLSAQHLYWPELDVDIEVESILHPERFPLVSRVHEAGKGYASAPQEEWDRDKVDECVLALLQLTLHDGARAWKRFDFDVIGRLFEKGYIFDPRGKSKSVVLTEKGLERSRELFEEMFGGRRGVRGN